MMVYEQSPVNYRSRPDKVQSASQTGALLTRLGSALFALVVLVAATLLRSGELTFLIVVGAGGFWLLEGFLRASRETASPAKSNTASGRFELFLRALSDTQVMLPHMLIILIGFGCFYTFVIAPPNPTTTLKDQVTALTSAIGIPAALLTAWKAIVEMHRGNIEKQQENRHKQASAAKSELHALFNDPLARAALQMLDWSGRKYNTGIKLERIYFEDLGEGLRTVNLEFDDKDTYIRDCFEKLYDALSMIEHLCQINFINFEDVAVPLQYYAKKIVDTKEDHYAFMQEYGYELAWDFVTRATPTQALPQET
jgi:hypothetical protein